MNPPACWSARTRWYATTWWPETARSGGRRRSQTCRRRVRRAGGGSDGPAAGSRLAARAGERRPVHECLPADGRPAASAQLTLTPVHRERAVEVAALPVHVDVQGVEAGTTVGQ